jgi:hypothetical protein
MAGYVRAHVQINPTCLSEVVPVACPAADEHTANEGLRCWAELPGNQVRACMYWISACENDNMTARRHPSHFAELAVQRNMRQIRCGVLCQRQRGNRPAGC